jgi:glycerol dehydrogenase-like iron-containing ADH family enzyme
VKQRQQAELEQALRNLQRQQKLLALGSGRKADVTRAEARVAELQQAKD